MPVRLPELRRREAGFILENPGEKVSIKINDLLSDDTLNLSLSDQQQIFNLLGGGIKRNGEYVPVEPSKVSEAIVSIE